MPKNNSIVKNVSLSGRWLDLHDRVTIGDLRLGDNYIGDPTPGWREEDFTVSQAVADATWFQQIPFKKIGLYIDEYRMSLPPRPDLTELDASLKS